MMNRRQASLRLSMNDISIDDTGGSYPLTNSIGYMSQYRDQIVFKNINMKFLLQEMYDQYEYFNIALVCIMSDGSAFGTATIDRMVRFEMSGLPWVNNTYNVSTMNNEGSAVMGFAKVSTSDTLLNYSYANMASFRKCENVDITINVKRYTGDTCTSTALLGRTDFYFKIFPNK